MNAPKSFGRIRSWARDLLLLAPLPSLPLCIYLHLCSRSTPTQLRSWYACMRIVRLITVRRCESASHRRCDFRALAEMPFLRGRWLRREGAGIPSGGLRLSRWMEGKHRGHGGGWKAGGGGGGRVRRGKPVAVLFSKSPRYLEHNARYPSRLFLGYIVFRSSGILPAYGKCSDHLKRICTAGDPRRADDARMNIAVSRLTFCIASRD